MSSFNLEKDDPSLSFIANKGKLGAQLYSHDWSASSVGHPATWPNALRTIVSLMLDSRFPMFIAWGPELGLIYNEAYSEFLGDKHPTAIGQPFQDVWSEIWHEVGPLATSAMAGQASYFEDVPLMIQRNGQLEQLYFSFSYSPASDDENRLVGMYCVVTETTARVRADKRHAFQLHITDSLRVLTDPIGIMEAASRLTGEYFKVGRVGYAEIDKKTASVSRDWTDGVIGSLAGQSRPLEVFGADIINELRSGKTIRIDDVAADARSAIHAGGYASINVQAMIVVPLLEGQWVTAVFHLHESSPRHWTDEEVALVEDVARRTSEAVRRARVEETLRDETRILELLNQTGRALASTLDLQTLLQSITDAGTQLSGAQFGAFFYSGKNAHGDALLLYTLSGAPIEAFEKLGHPRATEVFGPTFLGHPPIRSDDITKDPRYGQMAPYYGMPAGHLPVRSYLAVPVVGRSGEVLGALIFGHPEAGVFTERTERIISGVVAQAVVAIDNARLYEQAQKSAEERESLLASERSARAEAERLSRMKDEFLAMLAHELRNPLAPISSSADVLNLLFADDPRVRQTSAVISRQVGHMTRLIDDLLDVSRVTRGLIKLDLKSIDFRNIVSGALDQTRPLMDQKRHHIVVDVPAEPVWVEGDQTRLVQTVTNILNNAAKYTREGGLIEVELTVINDWLELRIRDNGSGMPPELVPGVFELFTQGARTLARSQGGLGLGLTLVKKLVELHGGTVIAHSDGPERGSEFMVSLPVQAADASSAAGTLAEEDEQAQRQGASRRPLRLMVIDDNVDAADSLATMLSAQGYGVSVEYSGELAFKRAVAEAPDALLIDIGLPDMDGYELAQRLRAEPRTAGAKLIAVTGYGQAKDRERAMASGFANHLVKPVDMAALAQALNRQPAEAG